MIHSSAAAEAARASIIRLCHSTLDSRSLRIELLRRLRPLVPFDSVYFTTTDPATWFGTSVVLLESPPPWMLERYLSNEFLETDLNKFDAMLRQRQPVAILSQSAQGAIEASLRYREILAPTGMGDELRAVFGSGLDCWGTLCLHRERGRAGYSPAEAAFVAALTPHITEGLRKALLRGPLHSTPGPDGPGVLILAEDLNWHSANEAARRWLAEFDASDPHGAAGLPLPVCSVVAGLLAVERGTAPAGFTPRLRLQTRSGQWLLLHASRLLGSEAPGSISVVFEVARAAELTPLILAAYALTRREAEIAQCVLQGWSTREIAARLHITPNTVQDHLKAIFAKAEVSSRGELVARLFARHYQNQFVAGSPPEG